MAFEQALEKAQMWAATYVAADNIPDDKIPDIYDFRNIEGNDLTYPVRN